MSSKKNKNTEGFFGEKELVVLNWIKKELFNPTKNLYRYFIRYWERKISKLIHGIKVWLGLSQFVSKKSKEASVVLLGLAPRSFSRLILRVRGKFMRSSKNIAHKLNNKAEKHSFIIKEKKLSLSYSPFLAVQGLTIFILTVCLLFAGLYLVESRRPKISDSSLIQTVRIYPVGPAVAGQSVKWVAVVDKQDITNSQYLLKLPKSAINVRIRALSEANLGNYLASIKNSAESSLTEKNRRQMAGVYSKGKNPLFAFLEQAAVGVVEVVTDTTSDATSAVVEIIQEITGQVQETDDAKVVDLSPEASDESVEPEPTIEATPAEEPTPTSEPDVTDEPTPVAESTTDEPSVTDTVTSPDQEIVEAEEEIIEEGEKVLVEFETPGAQITEQNTVDGKIVTVSSDDQPDQPPLTDVLAFTTIPEIYKVGQESKIKIKWKTNGDQQMEFHAYDLDNNGKLDYVEWTVPHLSEQVFEIIFASMAFRLDENTEIIEDIYDYIAAQDNNWAIMESGQYIRVTFEEMLSSSKDITLYARSGQEGQNARIEVYEENGDQIIASFEDVGAEKNYKIFLTNLADPTDIFDLKIIGDIDIDYIVDPAVTLYWVGGADGNISDQTNWSTLNPGACNPGGGDASAAPGASDTAYFTSSCTNSAAVDASWYLTSLYLDSGYTGTLTMTNAIYIANTWSNANSGSLGGGAFLYFNGSSATISGTVPAYVYFSYAGTTDLYSNLTTSYATINNGTTLNNSSYSIYALSWYNYGTISGSGNLHFNGASPSATGTLPGTIYFDYAGTATISGTFTSTNVYIDGATTLSGGTIYADYVSNSGTVSNNYFYVSSSWSNGGSVSGGFLYFTGSSASATGTLPGTIYFDYAGTTSLSSTITVSTIYVNNGTTLSGGTISATTVYIFGSVTSTTLNVSSVWSSSGSFTGGYLYLTGASATVSGTFPNDTTFNYAGTTTLSGTISGVINLTISGGTTVSTSSAISLTGNWSNSGSFSSSSTVTFNGSGTQSLNNLDSTFSGLTHSGSGTLQLSYDLHVDGTFTNSSGTFDSNNYDMTFSSHWNNTGSAIFTRGNGSMTFDGTSTLTNSSSNAADLGALVITGTATLGSNAAIASCSGAGTLNLGNMSYALTVSGSGSPLAVSNFDKGSGSTVTHTGTSATNVAVVAYNNLRLSGATTYSLAGNLTSSNAMSGNLTIDSGATLDASESDYNVALAGNWANLGTFTARNGTVALSGSSQTISGTSTFNDLTLTAPQTVSFTSGTTQTISGTFTCTGSAGNIITIKSSSAGTAASLSKSSGTVSCDYLSLKDSSASGGAIWMAGANSTNVSGNSGWNLDYTAPILVEVTAVPASTDNRTPNYTFSSSEAGTIIYGGDCSSDTTEAVSGNNVITFNQLSAGTYSNCTITVTDAFDNASLALSVSSFTIVLTGGSIATFVLPIQKTVQETVEQIAEKVKQISEQISEIAKNLVLPSENQQITYPPVEQVVTRETPESLQRKWDLVRATRFMKISILPLPDSIKKLALDFPTFQETLEKVGIGKEGGIEKLRVAKLSFPGLAETVGIKSEMLNIQSFTAEDKIKIPSNFVFARVAEGGIDLDTEISFGAGSSVIKIINTIQNKPLYLVIKPDREVSKITGYVVFKSVASENPRGSSTASASLIDTFMLSPESETGEPNGKGATIQKDLVTNKFEYTDSDEDGIYIANIISPEIEGNYNIKTVIEYKNTAKSSLEENTTLVVDPEGYIYESFGGRETRIKEAIATLYWLNTETKKYEVWPARDFQQKNPQITDKTGRYSFLVPEGQYYIEVKTNGYADYKGGVFEVTEGSGIHVNIELKIVNWWQRILTSERIIIMILLTALIVLMLAVAKKKEY